MTQSILDTKPVLVLNKHFTAIGVVSLQRAIVMLWSSKTGSDPKNPEPKAVVIESSPGYTTDWTWEEWALLRPEEGEEGIHSAMGVFRIPQVIKLEGYDRIPMQKVKFSRAMLHKRDQRTCQYCGYKPARQKKGAEDEFAELNIDHIEPTSKGGLTTWENCVITCVECNSNKADIPPKHVLVDVPEKKHGRLTGKLKKAPGFTVYFKKDYKIKSKTIPRPQKPQYNWFKGEVHYESWKQWMDVSYWHTELVNDNK